MNQMKTVKDIWVLFENGIWSYIQQLASGNDFATWLTAQKAYDLDVSFLSEYGDRPISPLINNLLVDGEMPTEHNTMLARYLYNRFINNWLHKLKIEQSQYELFKPYNISTVTEKTTTNTLEKTGTVTEVNDVDNTGTDNRSIGFNENHQLSGKDTETNTGTQTVNDTGTQTTADTGTQATADTGTQTNVNTGTQQTQVDIDDTTNTDVTNNNNVYGFNTSAQDGVPQSKQVSDSDTTVDRTEDTTRTDNLTATRTDNLTSTRTDNLQSQRTDNLQSERTDDLEKETTYGKKDTHTGSNTDNRTLNLNETGEKTTTNDLTDSENGTESVETTRQGNIGNILYQDILQKENDFWNDFNYTKSIFNDVISIIALPVYEIDI